MHTKTQTHTCTRSSPEPSIAQSPKGRGCPGRKKPAMSVSSMLAPFQLDSKRDGLAPSPSRVPIGWACTQSCLHAGRACEGRHAPRGAASATRRCQMRWSGPKGILRGKFRRCESVPGVAPLVAPLRARAQAAPAAASPPVGPVLKRQHGDARKCSHAACRSCAFAHAHSMETTFWRIWASSQRRATCLRPSTHILLTQSHMPRPSPSSPDQAVSRGRPLSRKHCSSMPHHSCADEPSASTTFCLGTPSASPAASSSRCHTSASASSSESPSLRSQAVCAAPGPCLPCVPPGTSLLRTREGAKKRLCVASMTKGQIETGSWSCCANDRLCCTSICPMKQCNSWFCLGVCTCVCVCVVECGRVCVCGCVCMRACSCTRECMIYIAWDEADKGVSCCEFESAADKEPACRGIAVSASACGPTSRTSP